jgi:hypothetical protein
MTYDEAFAVSARIWAGIKTGDSVVEAYAKALVDAERSGQAQLLAALKSARPIVQNFADGNEATYEMVCNAIAKAEDRQ